MIHGPPATDAEPAVWSQPHVTASREARGFLETLRARDALVLYAADGDIGYPSAGPIHHLRGQGASVSSSVVMATPPAPELVAYHRALGLGGEQRYWPARLRSGVPLARLVLEDTGLLDRIRRDTTLRRIVLAFKDQAGETLTGALGLAPAYCAPPAAVYEAANDKLEFSRAGQRYGFATVPMQPAEDASAVDAAFRALAGTYGAGCIVRGRRGAGGEHMRVALSPAAARRAWRRLCGRGSVLVVPRVPPALVERQVAAHGIVTSDGFQPLVFSDQILRGYRFRGSLVARNWSTEEIGAVSAALAAIGRWLRDLGYIDAPVGIDGLLVRDGTGLRFLALDPNVRMTGTMGPWAVVAALSEQAGRRFVWQTEHFATLGPPLSLAWLRGRLGRDLFDPARLSQGGILPSVIAPPTTGWLGISRLRVILLAVDADHLAHLRARIRRLALLVR